ncbi:MAG: Do family serine endopeptidase [Bdellovibrionota bacterium]
MTKNVFTFSGLVFLFFLAVPLAQSNPGPVDSNIFVNLSKKLVPSVVNISTLSTIKSPYMKGAPDDLFRRFFEDFFRQHGGDRRGGGGDEDEDEMPTPEPKGPKAVSLGTGFIIDSSGLILTNNHVVAGADEIKINFTEALDEKPTDGEVVGRDPELDIALIRVKTKREMTPVALGDSDQVDVGEYVMAIGNPFGQGHTVTHGIVSAKGRLAPEFPLANYLQTDAPINPGNSGGPLVNLKGEVIGINNAIDQRAQGIGFAIPINFVKKVLPQLRTKGVVARGYIGVLVNELTPEVAAKIGASENIKAPFVTHVYPGEPADKAGLKPYDIILEFNKVAIHSPAELISAVTGVPVGEKAPVKVIRSGKTLELSLKVSERPGSKKIATKAKEDEKKKGKSTRVQTGMTLTDITPELSRELGVSEKTKGVVIEAIAYGGPAEKAGLSRGDIIVEVDQKPVHSSDAFYAIVKEKKSYLLRVRRGDSQGQELFSVIVLDLR